MRADCRRACAQLEHPMPAFRNGEVEIAYLDEGEGDPIVLRPRLRLHEETNWVLPGWVTTLTRAGRRAIALDNRGHGASSKLYDPAAYHSATMAEDVRALLDHLTIERADVMGYSMGARITRISRSRTSGARARRRFSAVSASVSSTASACRKASPKRWRRHR